MDPSQASLEELRQIVVPNKESELNVCQRRRNKSQVEYASIRSYSKVTQQQCRVLERTMEAMDMEVEQAKDDHVTELQLYQQKSNFLQYCHANAIQAIMEVEDAKQQTYGRDQTKRRSDLAMVQEKERKELSEMEVRHVEERKAQLEEMDQDIDSVRQYFDLEVRRFQDECEAKQSQLLEELETKRQVERDRILSCNESHLQDLKRCHEKTCQEMNDYFINVERRQEMEMEDLQMELRRLKKAAIQHGTIKEGLLTSNQESGKELDVCLQKVANLERNTKTYTKDSRSLANTNARLALTKRRIRDAKQKFAKLQEDYSKLQRDTDMLRDGNHEATTIACKENAQKKVILENMLMHQKEDKFIMERHLHHIIHSAGLEEETSNLLRSNLQTFLEENETEVERLELAIACTKTKAWKLQQGN